MKLRNLMLPLLLAGCTYGPPIDRYPVSQPYVFKQPPKEPMLKGGLTDKEIQDRIDFNDTYHYRLKRGDVMDMARYDGSYHSVTKCIVDLFDTRGNIDDQEMCYDLAPGKEKKEFYKRLDSYNSLIPIYRVIHE